MHRLLALKRPLALSLPSPVCTKYFLKRHAFNLLRVRRPGAVTPMHADGGCHADARVLSGRPLPCTPACCDLTFWVVFWAPSGRSAEAERVDKVRAWRQASVLGSLSECLRRVSLFARRGTRPAPEATSPCERMQWAMGHDSDSTQLYPFTEVAVCSEDTEEAERLSRRLPGLRVRVAASYDLAAPRCLALGEYAPVLTDPGLARANTCGPFGGFMSLDLFDAEFMRYAGDMRWRFGSDSQAHGLFRGETRAQVQRTMRECSADCGDSRANIRIHSVLGRVRAVLAGRPACLPASTPGALHGTYTPRVAEGVVELVRFRVRPAPC